MASGKVSGLRVSWLLNGLLLAFILGFLGISGASIRESSAVWDEARRSAAMTRAAQEMFLAFGNLRTERSAVTALLQSSGAVTSQGLGEIVALRDQAARAMDAAAEQCASVGCGAEVTIGDLRTSRSALEATRKAVDAAVMQNPEKRPADLPDRWLAEIKPVLDQLDRFTAALTAKVRLTDATITEQLSLKDAGWAARDAASAERNLVAGAITAGGLSLAVRVRIAEQRGRIDTAWKLARDLAARPGMAAEMRDAVTTADRSYFTDLARQRAAIEQELLAGRPSPVPVSDYMKQANQALETLMAVPFAAFGAVVEIAEAKAAEARAQVVIHGVIVVLALVLGLAGLLLVRYRVVRPVVVLTAALQRLAAGDARAEIPDSARRDEIGCMMEAARIFKESVAERESMADRSRRQETMDSLLREFEQAAGEVVQSVTTAARDLDHAAGTMTGTADQTVQRAASVASLASAASTDVQTVASAGLELSAAVDEITRQVSESAQLVSRAVAETERTNAHVASLGTAAAKISGVVELISEIAAQTNLLALNATIEAARAGDAGRGFAVVAAEVKSLAGQTAKATSEISTQIEGVRAAMQDSASSMEVVAKVIGEVEGATTRIAAAVEEQGAATREIARSTEQVSSGTSEVASTIQEIDRAANQSALAAGEVRAAAGDLSNQAQQLSQQVASFIQRARAA